MPAPPEHMPCMEVWGGNQAVDGGVIMAGLDAWVYSRPYHDEAGGGDVYYVSSCATGRVTRLLVADVSGHGDGVAELGVHLRQLMRRYVNHIDQRRFVEALNRRFMARAGRARFATAVVATWFGPTRCLSLSNAGHPPPLLYSARTGAWSLLETAPGGGPEPGNVPLGVLETTFWDEHRLRLGVGDLLLCYTDALIEARDGAGRMLGREGLLEVVRGLEVSDGAALLRALREKVAGLSAGNLAEDDLTLLLVRPNGLGPRVPLRERALAPFRVLGGLIGSIRPGGRPMPWPELSLASIGGAMMHRFNERWRAEEEEAER